MDFFLGGDYFDLEDLIEGNDQVETDTLNPSPTNNKNNKELDGIGWESLLFSNSNLKFNNQSQQRLTTDPSLNQSLKNSNSILSFNSTDWGSPKIKEGCFFFFFGFFFVDNFFFCSINFIFLPSSK